LDAQTIVLFGALVKRRNIRERAPTNTPQNRASAKNDFFNKMIKDSSRKISSSLLKIHFQQSLSRTKTTYSYILGSSITFYFFRSKIQVRGESAFNPANQEKIEPRVRFRPKCTIAKHLKNQKISVFEIF